MTDSGTRKLAAVMFTDIAGYTSMVQSDEASALEKVNTHREVLDACTSSHGGQIISFYGDGSLSTYSSAIDAVNCAIQMQADYIKMGVPVRVGIHLGDIVYKQESVFGDGVNIASRDSSAGRFRLSSDPRHVCNRRLPIMRISRPNHLATST